MEFKEEPNGKGESKTRAWLSRARAWLRWPRPISEPHKPDLTRKGNEKACDENKPPSPEHSDKGNDVLDYYVSKLSPKQQRCFLEATYPMNMDERSVEKWIRKIFSHEDHESSAELKREIHGYLYQFAEDKRKLDREYSRMVREQRSKEELKRKANEISRLDRTRVLQGRYLNNCLNTIELAAMNIRSTVEPMKISIDELRLRKQEIALADYASTAKTWFGKAAKVLAEASLKITAGISTAVASVVFALRNLDQKTLLEWLDRLEKALKDDRLRETGLILIGAASGAVVFMGTVMYGVAATIDYLFNKHRMKLKQMALKACDDEIAALEAEREKTINSYIEIAKADVAEYFFEYRKQLCRMERHS